MYLVTFHTVYDLYSPNSVSSGSFLSRPKQGRGFNQTTDEWTRNSPIEISVTWESEWVEKW